MFKSTKNAAFFLFFTILGSTAVFAQTTQPMPQQQQQKVEVSDAELSKFASVFQQVRMMGQEVQQQMMTTVQEEGMDIQRFNEIQEAAMNPETEVNATAEEKKKHQEIISELEGIQAGFQEKLQKVITDEGLTMQRYEQIAMGIQNDPALQERLKKEFEG